MSRTLAIIAILAVVGAACGSSPTATDDVTSSPDVASTNDSQPTDAVDDFTIGVTATGNGGCVDRVEIQNLDDQSTADRALVLFDLVYVHSCGDRENTVRYDKPPVVRPATDGPLFTIRPPDCEDAACLVGTSLLLTPGDNLAPFRLETEGPLTEAEIEIVVPAFYDFSTASLSDDPLDVTLTVRVSKANPPLSGDTSPLATSDQVVEVVFSGFDEIPFPFAGVADTEAQLESFGLTAPKGIDWPTRAAVVFSIPTDLCPPVLAGLDINNGVAEPRFVNPGYNECDQPLLSHTVVAAVDREFLAETHTLRLPKQPPFFESDVDADVTITAPNRDTSPVSPPSPTFGTVEGPLPLPRQGEALSHQLENGTPLIIVHHHDSTVSALDARAPTARAGDGFTQQLVLVGWKAQTRNFIGGGVWDEFGRSTDGPRSADLRGFATRITDGDLEIGDHIDPPTGAPITVSPDPSAAADVSIRSDENPLTIDQALASPVGSVVFIDAQVVFVGSDARLCADDGTPIFEAEPCQDGSPPVEGVTGNDGVLNVWHAPILATRTADGFHEVVPLGGYSSSALN